MKINSASSQSVSQSGSSRSPRAHHTVSGDGSTPLGLNTNTEYMYLLARATQDLKFTVAASATPCRDRCAVTCVRRWYRYSVLEWGLVVAEGVSEAAGDAILGVLYVGVLVVHVRYTYCWYCSNSDSAERSRRFTLQTTRARGVSCRSLSRELEP